MSVLAGKTVALAVTGSIAAFKAPLVARLLIERGARVLPLMTRSATRFLGPVTLSGLTGEAVAVDMWDANVAGELHVDIAQRSDLVAIVPATADVLARIASGRADDLVAALALVSSKPLVIAPAMHPHMWSHPATQANVETIGRHGRARFVGPVDGLVASGERGVGRMAEPDAIVAAIEEAWKAPDLSGLRVVVSAGPTIEDLDPVRFLGNRSSGKMGFAIAERAARRGARTILVAGPVALPTPTGVERVDVRSALEMQDALAAVLGADLSGADALVMAAAVADYRPATKSANKLKKEGDRSTLELVRNPDLLAQIGAARRGAKPVLVGFAVETGDDAAVVAYARGKLAAKRVDLIVANRADDAFGRDDNRVSFVSATSVETSPTMDKGALADRILDRVRSLRASE